MEDLILSVMAVLETTPGRWEDLARQFPRHLLAHPAAPGEWSALQCLQHILDTEDQVFTLRISRILEGQDFPGFDPDSEGGRPSNEGDPVQMANDLRTRRQASLQKLEILKPEDLQRTGTHPELGEVSLGELLQEWGAHDLMHTVQAERALMQPFIEGSGPWRPYFADHVARAKG
jgi:hypothetical protein